MLLLVDMHDLRRRKAIEVRGTSGRIGPDILTVEVVAEFKIRQLFGEANRIEGIARGAEDRADLRGPLSKTLHVVGAVIKNHTGVCVVHAIVHVITKLFVPERLTDDLRHGIAGRRH